ncbi:MAG TPA: CYTH and CHAD domain-containing protein [Alphaproteobacteria bacterium]|nr:CYTH and CHAD domain-containing protein [Alphaproteobacteria bacterium]
MSGANEPTEVELTLRMPPDSVSRLLRDPFLRKLKQGPSRTRWQVSTYFDTDDFRLERERAALRVRQIGSRCIQTLKLAPVPEKGVIARREWEREVTDNTPDLRDIDDRHVRRLLDGDIADRLAPIFVTEIKRSTMPLALDGSTIELAVDVGEIKTESGSIPVCEAELELKSGRVETVYKLAQELNRRVPLTIEPLSKSERGYALLRNRKPGPRRAEGVRLDKDMRAGAAFQIVARNCLLHLRANEASVRAAAVADSIHQLRVGVRRLRSALVAFGHLMPADERRRVSKSVRWIAQQCGRARELDVFKADVIEPLRQRMPNEASLIELERLVAQARDDAYASVSATLDDKQYTETLLALEAWVEGERWNEGAGGGVDIPVRDFARAVLKRLHRKLTKGVKAIDALDEEALHELRIRAKKLRYSAEFFRSLFRDKPAKAYLAALTAVQDRLGTLNDGAVARQLVSSLEERRGGVDADVFARGTGIVLGWNACRIAADLKQLPAAWERFTEAKLFWK